MRWYAIHQQPGVDNPSEYAGGKVKAGVLHPVQQPGPYWEKPSALSVFMGRTHTKVIACDQMTNLLTHWDAKDL